MKIWPNCGFKHKKRTWKLRLTSSFLNFCTYAKFFAKTHAHWGEKIKSQLQVNKKSQIQCNFFSHQKRTDWKWESQHAGNWPLVLSSSVTRLINVNTSLHFALNAGSVQLNRSLTHDAIWGNNTFKSTPWL